MKRISTSGRYENLSSLKGSPTLRVGTILGWEFIKMLSAFMSTTSDARNVQADGRSINGREFVFLNA
jgi:hypothetical protein